MAGLFEVVREIVSLTATVARLEKENEGLRSRVREIEARLSALEGSGAVLSERAARAASEAAMSSYIPIMERLIRLEVDSRGGCDVGSGKAKKLITRET